MLQNTGSRGQKLRENDVFIYTQESQGERKDREREREIR